MQCEFNSLLTLLKETQPVVEAGAPGKNQWVDMQEVNTLKEAIESCKNDFTELRCVGSQVDGNGVVKVSDFLRLFGIIVTFFSMPSGPLLSIKLCAQTCKL